MARTRTHRQPAILSSLSDASFRAALRNREQREKLKERIRRLKKENRALVRELELWKEAREHTWERGDFFRRLSRKTVEKLREAEQEWEKAKKKGEDAKKVLRILGTAVRNYRRDVEAGNTPATLPATPETPPAPPLPLHLLDPSRVSSFGPFQVDIVVSDSQYINSIDQQLVVEQVVTRNIGPRRDLGGRQCRGLPKMNL